MLHAIIASLNQVFSQCVSLSVQDIMQKKIMQKWTQSTYLGAIARNLIKPAWRFAILSMSF